MSGNESDRGRYVQPPLNRNLQMEAFVALMTEKFEQLNARIDGIEGMAANHAPNVPNRRAQRAEEEGDVSEGVEDEVAEDGGEERQHNRGRFGRGNGNREARRGRPGRDDDLGSIKVTIPSFQGRNEPEVYLEWEQKIEMVFECHNYSEMKKVKLAAIEFTDYAIIWWDQLLKERRRNRERTVETWEEMKAIMRRRFIPSYYHRELYNKLQRLTQGIKSVDEYFKEMEVAMIRANVVEDREATMARFLHGLNREIADVVEMQHHVELTDMVHQAVKAEQQLKRRNMARRGPSMSSTNSWRAASRRDEFQANKPKFDTLKNVVQQPGATQGNKEANSTKTRDIKCFKCRGSGHIASECPNKRVMVINAQGQLESEDEEDEVDEDMPPLEDCSDGEYPVDGELLVARRALSAQVKKEENNQRENLFHTRCFVNRKVCSVIIDGGSCTNVASNELVEKLALPTLKHPRPYRLQWLNDSGNIKVTKQVLVAFSISKYEEQVLCDVVPMHACHMLLGVAMAI